MCLGDLQLNWCVIYLDNIIVFDGTPKEHICRLHVIFLKLCLVGMKLKLRKCEFFHKGIVYLGNGISHMGICTDTQKIGSVLLGLFLKWSWTSAVSSVLQTTTSDSSKYIPRWFIPFMPCCWERTPVKRTSPLSGTWSVRRHSRISRTCVALLQCWLLPTSVNLLSCILTPVEWGWGGTLLRAGGQGMCHQLC